eukprot:IDg6745t1
MHGVVFAPYVFSFVVTVVKYSAGTPSCGGGVWGRVHPMRFVVLLFPLSDPGPHAELSLFVMRNAPAGFCARRSFVCAAIDWLAVIVEVWFMFSAGTSGMAGVDVGS